jgi:hypothetical protein
VERLRVFILSTVERISTILSTVERIEGKNRHILSAVERTVLILSTVERLVLILSTAERIEFQMPQRVKFCRLNDWLRKQVFGFQTRVLLLKARVLTFESSCSNF